jgi:xanthine dehydrogenase YagS FAD-binding subunit
LSGHRGFASVAQGEYRAGGTDLQQRLRRGVAAGPPVAVPDRADLRAIHSNDDGSVRIGALVTIAAIAGHPQLSATYPALARAAAALATPQIRAVGTLGGNLLQRNRCWYFRDPVFACFKKGGDCCPAREGNHLYHACFDLGPCIAVHPSTLAMALLTYDATIETASGATRSVAGLYGDGSDPHHDHQLGPDLLIAVHLPPALEGERGAYFRATARALAEWPLVEAAVRLRVEQGIISFARVAIGGVAPIPLRREQTRYKLDLIGATIVTVLQRAQGPDSGLRS